MDVPKSITFIEAYFSFVSNNKFSGFKSLYFFIKKNNLIFTYEQLYVNDSKRLH